MLYIFARLNQNFRDLRKVNHFEKILLEGIWYEKRWYENNIINKNENRKSSHMKIGAKFDEKC